MKSLICVIKIWDRYFYLFGNHTLFCIIDNSEIVSSFFIFIFDSWRYFKLWWFNLKDQGIINQSEPILYWNMILASIKVHFYFKGEKIIFFMNSFADFFGLLPKFSDIINSDKWITNSNLVKYRFLSSQKIKLYSWLCYFVLRRGLAKSPSSDSQIPVIFIQQQRHTLQKKGLYKYIPEPPTRMMISKSSMMPPNAMKMEARLSGPARSVFQKIGQQFQTMNQNTTKM